MLSNIQRRSTGDSLLAVFHPRGQLPLFAAAAIGGALIAWMATTQLSLPLWSAVVIVVAMLCYPAVRKWRLDRHELGTPAMVLSVLVATQGFHTIEHVAQFFQYHVLGWQAKASGGLISPLNAEIVHFSWNVAVWVVIAYLLLAGSRNVWMWLLMAWATAHLAEHTYLFANYLQAIGRLRSEGLPLAAAQGMPGFFGKGGWLAANAPAAGPIAYLCSVAPGLTAAPRLDVHFWWNMGEVALLLPAAHYAMRGRR